MALYQLHWNVLDQPDNQCVMVVADLDEAQKKAVEARFNRLDDLLDRSIDPLDQSLSGGEPIWTLDELADTYGAVFADVLDQ